MEDCKICKMQGCIKRTPVSGSTKVDEAAFAECRTASGGAASSQTTMASAANTGVLFPPFPLFPPSADSAPHVFACEINKYSLVQNAAY
jgi:hypothetical protein